MFTKSSELSIQIHHGIILFNLKQHYNLFKKILNLKYFETMLLVIESYPYKYTSRSR